MYSYSVQHTPVVLLLRTKQNSVSHDALTELLKQPQFSPLKTEEQVAVIFAGVNGYLDDLALNQVGPFEQGLLTSLRADHKELLDAIAEKKALDDDLTEKLKSALDAYAKSFA